MTSRGGEDGEAARWTETSGLWKKARSAASHFEFERDVGVMAHVDREDRCD